MAYHRQTSVTIKGITYSYLGSFKCAAAYGGNSNSEGTGNSAKTLTKGTTYYTASQCCWEYRGINKPDKAPDSNIFVLDNGVLTLEILYNVCP